jgi:hypothetical protein
MIVETADGETAVGCGSELRQMGETSPCPAEEQIGSLSGDEKSSLVGRHRESNVIVKGKFRFTILHLIPRDEDWRSDHVVTLPHPPFAHFDRLPVPRINPEAQPTQNRH